MQNDEVDEVDAVDVPHVRSTFGSSAVQKVQAVVVRSTFGTQNVQNTSVSEHFWNLRCWKSARRCGTKHISKLKCAKLQCNSASEHFRKLRCHTTRHYSYNKNCSSYEYNYKQQLQLQLQLQLPQHNTPQQQQLQLQLQLQQLHYNYNYNYNCNCNCNRNCNCNYNNHNNQNYHNHNHNYVQLPLPLPLPLPLHSTTLHYHHHYQYHYHYFYHCHYHYHYTTTKLQLQVRRQLQLQLQLPLQLQLQQQQQLQLQQKLHYHYTTTTATLRYSTPHYIQQLWVKWPLQPLQKAQLQPPFRASVRSAMISSQQVTYPIVSYLWNFRHHLVRYYWYVDEVESWFWQQFFGVKSVWSFQPKSTGLDPTSTDTVSPKNAATPFFPPGAHHRWAYPKLSTDQIQASRTWSQTSVLFRASKTVPGLLFLQFDGKKSSYFWQVLGETCHGASKDAVDVCLRCTKLP